MDTQRFECSVSGAKVAACFLRDLPGDVIARSDVLQTASSDGEDVPRLVLPPGCDDSFFDEWVELVVGDSDASKQKAVTALLKGLQAADFFADEDAVKSFCSLLAKKMFFEEHEKAEPRTLRATPARKRQRTIKKRLKLTVRMKKRVRGDNNEIIQHLPQHLARTVISHAKDHVLPSTSPSTDEDEERFRDSALLATMRVLPPTYHPMALLAHCQDHSASDLPGHVENDLALSLTQDLHSCEVYAFEKAEVLAALASLTGLTGLYLSGTWVRDSTQAIQAALTSVLTSLVHLEKLTVDNVGDRCATVVASNLSCLTKLTRLGLRECNRDILASTVEATVQSASKLPSLAHLDLTDFCVYHDGCSSLCAALASMTSLTYLDLSECFVFCRQWQSATEALGAALRRFSRLQHLKLERCFARDYIEPVFDACATLTELTTLSINEVAIREHLATDIMNSMADMHGQRLVPMLRDLPNLVELGLDRYNVAEALSADTAEALGKLTNLTSLSLRSISGDPGFFEALAERMPALQALRELRLGENDTVSDETLPLLAEAFAKMPALVDIQLSSCEIGSPGASELAKALTALTALSRLDLSHNFIGQEAQEEVYVAVEKALGQDRLREPAAVVNLDSNQGDDEQDWGHPEDMPFPGIGGGFIMEFMIGGGFFPWAPLV